MRRFAQGRAILQRTRPQGALRGPRPEGSLAPRAAQRRAARRGDGSAHRSGIEALRRQGTQVLGTDGLAHRGHVARRSAASKDANRSQWLGRHGRTQTGSVGTVGGRIEGMIRSEVTDGIAVLTLDHPEKRNALSRAMMTELL